MKVESVGLEIIPRLRTSLLKSYRLHKNFVSNVRLTAYIIFSSDKYT